MKESENNLEEEEVLSNLILKQATIAKTGPLLSSTFKTVRGQVYSNNFMNGDTIALLNEDKFIDSGISPLGMRPRSDIIEKRDFWLLPIFTKVNGQRYHAL